VSRDWSGGRSTCAGARVPDALSGERFRLEVLELGLVDGAAVEQRLGAPDLARRAAVGGDLADVAVEVGL
jgi:hypothetical protein